MLVSPPHLSQYDRSVIFGVLDQELNCMILQALLHGLYTGIVVVTLWTIFSSPKWLRSTFLRTTIITLYVLSTIVFAMYWVFDRHAFIEHGDNYHSMFAALVDFGPWGRVNYLVGTITGGISTFLVDIMIIWRCWVLWDRQWRIIFVPMVCAVAGTVMKAMQTISTFRNSAYNISSFNRFAAEIDWSLIYILLTLLTTLMCTLLIIYRIVRHAPGMSASRKIIEMLIESSAMYSLSLIIYLALVSQNSESRIYADTIAAYVRVSHVPTFLVGRVSAHANTSSRRQQMVAMWENHPPLVGCFREEVIGNIHSPDDGHQTVSGSSMGKETV
ncbi:hypothetical protein EV421DRAFT_2042523 [Armillaria borealis]|uniref:Uncharacterized protein n=1 Tax=Armillaria borealis TaxID=47425 RepID=A0AA39ISP7_9AGAR|nr:hypothetical protein EV421DRAFT_2042523 [Armillaria borealis]